MELKGAVCIVTGSASGIGAATVQLLARKGARVVVNYTKSEAQARATRDACVAAGSEALLLQADVTRDADCRRMAQAALDKWGRIDALVNNAGTTKYVDHADLDGLSGEDFLRIYGVNVVGAFQMARACVPALRAGGRGAIVNTSSIAGVKGVGSSIAYAASKGALNTLTLSLARVLGPEIRVNAVCPGFIDTEWMHQRFGDRFEAAKERYIQNMPLARVGTPEDVADAIVWLIEGAAITTGETILLDGGTHLGMPPRKL
jgi:3-oxoacyl-[acyl-carrier protein] reductase